jgi:hypothetical protein
VRSTFEMTSTPSNARSRPPSLILFSLDGIHAHSESPMKLSMILIALTAFTLTSCATSTAVERYSESSSHFSAPPTLMSHHYAQQDLYRVYQQAATGFVSISTLREEIEDRAEKFCSRQGKKMVLLGEKISQPPYILGNFPRIEIVFAAVEMP